MKLYVKIFLLIICIAWVQVQSLSAQDSSSVNFAKTIYSDSWAVGFRIHTRGIGGEFRRERFVNATIKNFWNIDISNIKHIKEQKSVSQIQDDEKLVYGKLNSFYQIRAGVGNQKVMFKKLVEKGVQISRIYSFGLAAAWLKPVYVKVQDITFNDNPKTSSVRYNPYQHSYGDITSGDAWAKGLSDSKLLPGLTAKIALNFEYSGVEDQIKALEIGAQLDGFTEPIPLMAFNRQYNVFFNLYMSFLFGSKTYL